MQDQPLVSVIMTAYNREKFIAEAIESVLQSDYSNFELLIFDDCSSDGTVLIAQEYAGKDSRVKIHINPTNLGDYPNRNFAAANATGKYIMFCDSDDTFYPDIIGYCVSAMEANPKAGFGTCYDQLGQPPFLLTSKEAIHRHFFVKPVLSMGPGGTIIKRSFFECIGGYPEKYGPANDMYFNLKAASAGDVLFLPKGFLFYRIHEGQEKNNLFSYIHYNYRYYADALKELNLGLTEKELNFLAKKNDRRFIYNVVQRFRQTKKIADVIYLFKKAHVGPWNVLRGIFHI